MDEVKAVQKFMSRCTEEVVEESKFLVLFKDFTNDFLTKAKTIVSEKVKLFFADAEWWATMRTHPNDKRYIFIKVHISRSAGQVQIENSKFSFAIRANASKSEWFVMTNDKIQYETSEICLDTNNSKDFSIDMVLTIKRSDDFPIKNKFSNPIKDYCNIIDNISKLMNDSTFADFKFIVKGKEFKIQKCILAASSPVFARLFTSDMQETRENICIIDSFEPEIFESVLQFIYRAKLPTNFPEIAQEIYEAADYYDLKRLKDICANEIHSQLSKENAVELYCWAFPYDSLDELKKDSWIIVKRDVLHMYFRIKNEPLPPEALKELIEHKKAEQHYMKSLEDDSGADEQK